MFRKIKSSLIIAASLAALMTPMLLPATVSAVDPTGPSIQNSLCGGTDNLQLDATNANCDPNNSAGNNSAESFNNIITTIVNLFSVVVGIIAVIMIIVGGFKYITSGGESNKVSSAKNTILFALVGLIIVGLAQFIVHFVLGHVAGVGGSGSLIGSIRF